MGINNGKAEMVDRTKPSDKSMRRLAQDKDLRQKRIMVYSPTRDRPEYVADAPSASQFVSLMRSADNGFVDDLMRLDEEMESKDAHLHGVAETRRTAITALDWEVEPDPSAKDQKLAEAVAAHIGETLRGITQLDLALEHFTRAIGPGISVGELVWEGVDLVDVVPVPGHRLVGNTWTGELGIITEDDALGIDIMEGKFAVNRPKARAGFQVRNSITRAQAWVYLAKHYAKADWVSFIEMFGQPTRIAKVNENVSPDDRDEIKDMMQNIASAGWALFTVSDPNDIMVEFKEASRTNDPYDGFIQWLEKKQSILYLGQTLTTDVGDGHSFAAAKVHDNVRADILASDLKSEKRFIRDQIFRPIAALRWPGRSVPLPEFHRQLVERPDIEKEQLWLDKMRFAREIGLGVDESTVYDQLNIPRPAGGGGERVLFVNALDSHALDDSVDDETGSTDDRRMAGGAGRPAHNPRG